MNTYISHREKGVLFALVVLVVLALAVQAFETKPDSQEVTLSATVREPSGMTDTVAFTFELEEFPSTSAVMNNYSMLPPQPSAVPEPATLVLVGLGVLGLIILRRTWEKQNGRNNE